MPTHEDIAAAAYCLWEKNPDSDAEANWLKRNCSAKTSDSELLHSPDVVNTGAEPDIVR